MNNTKNLLQLFYNKCFQQQSEENALLLCREISAVDNYSKNF